MKRPSILFAFLLISSIITSCCKGPFQVLGIVIQYPSITSPTQLHAIVHSDLKSNTVRDTLTIGELNSMNDYALLFELTDDAVEYVLFTEDLRYVDTISDIQIQRKGCKEKLEHFSYHFNGSPQSTTQIVVN